MSCIDVPSSVIQRRLTDSDHDIPWNETVFSWPLESHGETFIIITVYLDKLYMVY